MYVYVRVVVLLCLIGAACGGAEGNAIRASALDAMATVLRYGGDKASASAVDKVRPCGLKRVESPLSSLNISLHTPYLYPIHTAYQRPLLSTLLSTSSVHPHPY